MMTIQARETLAPRLSPSHSLRAYPANSPRARARLLVLALLADGRLDKREFEALDARDVYAALGLSREDFIAVLFDFCDDASCLPNRGGSYLLSPTTLDGLFAEVDRPDVRKALMRDIFAIICSDGALSEGEERLFWKAVDSWNLGRPAVLPEPAEASWQARPPAGRAR